MAVYCNATQRNGYLDAPLREPSPPPLAPSPPPLVPCYVSSSPRCAAHSLCGRTFAIRSSAISPSKTSPIKLRSSRFITEHVRFIKVYYSIFSGVACAMPSRAQGSRVAALRSLVRST